MNRDLPPEAVAFGAAAARALAAAGGIDLARRAEAASAVRAEAAGVLGRLGVGDLDPRADLETACAAAELCRAAGAAALPYPVVGTLLAGDGAPLAVVGGGQWRVDHGDLFPRWRVAGPDGRWRTGCPVGPPLGTRLGPFVTDLAASGTGGRTVDGGDGAGAEVALHLVLSGWRLLGVVQRAVALAVAHVRHRVQFGRPLAAFQAVQFQVADASVAVDGLDELCRFTLWRLSADPDAALVDALALRLHALDVARLVLRTSQQLHGAAGMCDEYDISILCRHVQPDLRLPWGSEATAARLLDAAAVSGFSGLFPHH
ncbi:MAG TPA: acyl-CoA dehydrogenase family protein [Acidimicrobiales bacterium]|nr:acyl-CoA dehydrogenase family protein [Acidimicrobiales bacterium]